MTQAKVTPNDQTRRGILLWAIKMAAMCVIYGALLFLAAGRLNWTFGWVYLGVTVLTQVLCALLLIPRRPDLIAERSKMQAGTKKWDQLLAPLISLAGPLFIMVTAGLDARFGWSTLIPTAPGSAGSAGSVGDASTVLWIAALILAIGSSLFTLWAMMSNPFFASTVRIQDDRGQNVVSAGPYRIVRHPGYLGAVVFDLAAPLVLGSLWTFVPSIITVVLLFVRTGLEDRTLQNELPGYAEYAAKVRSRLIPGIW